MTEQEFISKWNNPTQTGPHWGLKASLVYWAMSYEMAFDKLFEMSNDFMSIPGIASMNCSSVWKAEKILKNKG